MVAELAFMKQCAFARFDIELYRVGDGAVERGKRGGVRSGGRLETGAQRDRLVEFSIE